MRKLEVYLYISLTLDDNKIIIIKKISVMAFKSIPLKGAVLTLKRLPPLNDHPASAEFSESHY